MTPATILHSSLLPPPHTTPLSRQNYYPRRLLPSLPSTPLLQSPLQSDGPRRDTSSHLPPPLLDLLRLSVRGSDVRLAKAVHASIAKTHFQDSDNSSLIYDNTLIFAYAKLGAIADARKAFQALLAPDVASYASLISAYAKARQEIQAVHLFVQMVRDGIQPNGFAFVAILTASIRLPSSELGFQIHAFVVKCGYVCSVFVSNAITAMYLKTGEIKAALQVFDEMPERDVASFNTVISGLVQEFRYDEAFELFRGMQLGGFGADQFSLSSLLISSGEVKVLGPGKEIHAHALRGGFESNLSVNNALIGFYTKCGSLKDVVGIFERMPKRDVISWTEMVNGYMEFGLVESAIEIFDQMPEWNCVSYNALLTGFCQNGEGLRAFETFCRVVKDGVELSDFTLTNVLNACALLSDVKKNEQVHGFVIKVGSGLNSRVEAALLNMYTKCGRMGDARKIFDQWSDSHSRSIAWTSMICGYAQNGQPEEAMSLFCVEQEAIMDEVALATVLGLCGTLGYAHKGKQLHSSALKSGFLSDLTVGNAAISMYAKCGSLDDAVEIFNLMPKHNTVSWNALMGGYLLHRKGEEALCVWEKMDGMGIKPDSVSFVLILSAYRHIDNSNSVGTCRNLFNSMRRYGIEPDSEHYASMVHVLGYWDLFEEAEELIKSIPFKPNASVWRALLDSCRLRENTSLGKKAAQHLLDMEPQDPSMYILVSNLYSASGRWHCSEMVREEMKQKGMHKHPARSWIIQEDKIHSFYARDRFHSQAKDIYRGLEILILECMKAGYVPDLSFVLHEVEEYQKKDFLMYHSSKLAVTYGLLTTGPGKPVRVMKNIHLCGDCHNFFKSVSITTGREISIRDASGFHSFWRGQCSCRDYW